MMRCSGAFKAQRIATIKEAEEVLATCDRLAIPAPGRWISGRVATLLSHYFVSASDERVMSAIAEDWVETLKDYPAWAIQNACRWWMSAENQYRHRKPLPGDVEDACKREVAGIIAARTMAKLGPPERGPQREHLSPEVMEKRKSAADRIMQEVLGG